MSAALLTGLQRVTSAIPGMRTVKRSLRDDATACGVTLWLGTTRHHPGFTILAYHRVWEHPDPYYPVPYGVSLKVFQAQLELVKRFCTVLSLDEMLARLDAGQPLPRRCVAITFDDGYRDVAALAWPLLKHYGLPMTLYAAVDALERGWLWPDLLRHAIRTTRAARVELESLKNGSSIFDLSTEAGRLLTVKHLDARLKTLPDELKWRVLEELSRKLLRMSPEAVRLRRLMLSWRELKTLAAEGVAIGSHTLTHPILTQASDAAIARELTQSRHRLEEALDGVVAHFAYPNGQAADVSPRLAQRVAAAGYRSAVTMISGINAPSDDRYLLKRINGAQVSVKALVDVLIQETAGHPNGV